jgi:hypothetical protein
MAQQAAGRVIGIDILDHSLLIRWRSRFIQDGATRYAEVEGGLNRMTLRRFRRLVARSPLRFETFETIPIRRLRVLANRLTQNSSPPPCAAFFGGGM